ncbi:hypothetical protein DUNSADRAFT_14844 [Dunaliella salina]|uniref:Uncharacterized protein n=1 Tax=Dunaliella salina TaxID=3046 RepID=A0ABQ7H2F9_DUNSA|nr:hypothetical protein DUNSADRAFT_14844 [Dunaliella salina]|eukprot:KAF5840988.1 hypothetical protein DUNSADRAFT_14844 [Dunaliella salina]
MLQKLSKPKNRSVQFGQWEGSTSTCWRRPVVCKANSKQSSEASLSSSDLHASRIQDSGPGLDLERMDLSPQAASPSSRLKAMSSSLIEQMQHEAGQRLALQQQLLRAQQEVLDAYFKEDASNEERDALRAQAERLSTTVSMMENRFSKLQADLEVNEARVSQHLPPSPTSPFSRLIHNSSICRSVCAGLRSSLEATWNWAVGTASTANRQGTKAEDKEEGTDFDQALQSSHQALSESRDALTTERDALAEQLSAQQQALEQATSAQALSTASLQREVESTRAELSTTLQKLEGASEQQAKLDADVHSLRAEASAASQERDTSLQELSRMQAELKMAQEGQAQLHSSLDSSRARQAEQEAAAQLQLATVQAALDNASELLRSTLREKESLGLRSSQAQEQVRALSQELQSLLDGRRRAESEIGSMRQQLVDLQAQQEQAQQQRAQQQVVQQEGAAAADSRRDVQRLQIMLNTSERERDLEMRVLSSNYRNLASQNAALAASVEQLVGKLQKAELELLESQAMQASEASTETPAVRAARRAAAAASDRAAAAEASLQAQTDIANAATSRASAAEEALQEQMAATAAESARAAAAEDALQKQVAAATAALEHSVAAEKALQEMREAATSEFDL